MVGVANAYLVGYAAGGDGVVETGLTAVVLGPLTCRVGPIHCQLAAPSASAEIAISTTARRFRASIA
jgi:hypothetical protein